MSVLNLTRGIHYIASCIYALSACAGQSKRCKYVSVHPVWPCHLGTSRPCLLVLRMKSVDTTLICQITM